MPALLDVQRVTVRFGGLVALHEVSVTVDEGEVVGIIGPNGAGKTTLFNVVCGFTRPGEGAISWQGRPLRRHHPRDLARLGIARTLQGLGLYAHLSVLDNVLVGADVHSRSGLAAAFLASPTVDRDDARQRDRAMAELAALGLEAHARSLPGALPYGLQKRVALARALVAEPKLLLLDEPASGLSNDEMRELATLIRELRERMSVLLVEHHMDLVMQVCDRIVVLDFGRCITTGPPAQVRADPRVLEAYLGEQIDEGTAEVADAAD